MGEASSASENNEMTKALIKAAEGAKEEIKQQAAATMPVENNPHQIALWLAGILLAVAIASITKGGSSGG